MKKMYLLLILSVLLLFIASLTAVVSAADATPCEMIIKLNNSKEIGRYKAVKVRINSNKDEFLGTSFFISLDNVKDFAKKRNVACEYDVQGKKLKLGKKSLDVIAPDPKATSSFNFGKVKMVTISGKPYFDFMDFCLDMGFSSYSKLSYGFSLTEQK